MKELVVPAGETGIVYAREVGSTGIWSGCSKIVMDDNGREFVLSLPSPNARDNEIPIGDKTIGLEVHTYPGKECGVEKVATVCRAECLARRDVNPVCQLVALLVEGISYVCAKRRDSCF